MQQQFRAYPASLTPSASAVTAAWTIRRRRALAASPESCAAGRPSPWPVHTCSDRQPLCSPICSRKHIGTPQPAHAPTRKWHSTPLIHLLVYGTFPAGNYRAWSSAKAWRVDESPRDFPTPGESQLAAHKVYSRPVTPCAIATRAFSHRAVSGLVAVTVLPVPAPFGWPQRPHEARPT